MRSYQVFWLVFVASLYCLHTLRNFSAVYAVAPPFFSIIGAVFVFLLNKEKAQFDSKGFILFVFFAFSSVLPVLYSVIWYPDEDYLQSYFRYFYLVPFVFFGFVAINRFEALEVLLKTYTVFVLLGAFSIFYQVFFGPISWFAEPSEREGLIRFSSLLGSLTAYGVYSVFAIPVILFLFNKRLIQFFMLLVIVFGMLMTLQKAAVMNILIFFFLAFLYEQRAVKVALVVSFLSGLAILCLAYLFDLNYIVSTVDNVVRVRSDSGMSDVSVYQSIVDRVWGLPAHLYELHGGFGMALGVGMVGGSGTLGFVDFPMAHNGFFDLLFIGGVANLLAFLLLWFFVLSRIKSLLNFHLGLGSLELGVCRACWYISLLFIVNFIFSGALYFQPYGGIIFYAIAVFFLLHAKRMQNA